jgi:chemotaxis protein histidine kinase CheA
MISEEELERRLAVADRKIAGASLGFTDWAGTDIAEALSALDRIASGEESEEVTNLIFRVAHDLKGQGTTFGYPLVTEISGLLCDFIRLATPSASADMVSVIRAHLSALSLILKQNIKGEGDAATKQLVEKLALAADRVKPKG